MVALKKKKNAKKPKEVFEEDTENSQYTRLGLPHGTQRGIIAIGLFLLASLFILSTLGLSGKVGDFIYEEFLILLFGYGFILIPIFLLTLAVMTIKSSLPSAGKKQWASVIVLLISTLGLLDVLFSDQSGGVIGSIGRVLVRWFDVYASVLIFIALMIISFLILFETELRIPRLLRKIFSRESSTEIEHERVLNLPPETPQPTPALLNNDSSPIIHDTMAHDAPEPETEKKKTFSIFGKSEKESSLDDIKVQDNGIPTDYIPPPLSLLSKSKGKASVGDIKANANLIKRTLQNFGIDVEMDEVSIGPTVTRYALKPAEGIKLSRIVALQNDLALSLAAHPLRIEAPIPGKALVGIEIPNRLKSMVGLGSLVSEKEFVDSAKPLLVCLGKGVTGKSYYADIAKMPHLLIAGATGSGKSVTVHNMIISLLYRKGPENLRFIMIDPKRVELTLYNSIPHLLTPVIKDPKNAILALKWAIKEMERRYDILEGHSVRDIGSYHSTIVEPAYQKAKKSKDSEDLPERMPYIVIIIDELADLMQTYPRELEASIVRLAQMSRAVGIHLILSTQRPSVNVITGLIKANIPARIALQVSSQIDSRTILDIAGAEKLLGAGDMLYTGSEMSKPERMQSAFISEDEVKNIVIYLAEQHRDTLHDEINFSEQSMGSDNAIFSATMDDDVDDDLYEEAENAVREAGKASTSYLQRKLKIGYSRAARLMDILEERNVIGPANGSKPRDVIDQTTSYENTEE